MKHIGAVLFVFILLAAGCRSDQIQPSLSECSGVVRYSTDIRPLILSQCAITGCHVSGFQSGDFTQYQPLKDKADNGRLRLFVIELRNMPPSGSITEEQRQVISCWLEQGAPNN